MTIVLSVAACGPYRARTGDLHNAIVALSHAELTARKFKYSGLMPQSQFALPASFSYYGIVKAMLSIRSFGRTDIRRSFSRALLLLLPFVGSIVVFWSSCKDTVTGSTPDVVFPATHVSYSQHVDLLFAEACAYSGCHAGSSPAKNLNLERPSYTNLMNFNTPILVHPGDTTTSPLLMYLDGRLSPPMPPVNRPKLTANQIRGMKQWVLEGAPNN